MPHFWGDIAVTKCKEMDFFRLYRIAFSGKTIGIIFKTFIREPVLSLEGLN